MSYSNPKLVNVIYEKTLAYNKTRYWPEMSGANRVLDFGGGFGVHYKQLGLAYVKWAVVEQAVIVDKATDTDNLKFFKNISDALEWLGKPNIVHCDGALQYTSDPVKVLAELVAIQANRMLWYRIPLSNVRIIKDIQKSRLADNGPGKGKFFDKFKFVEYERTIIPQAIFMKAHKNFELYASYDDNYWFEKCR